MNQKQRAELLELSAEDHLRLAQKAFICARSIFSLQHALEVRGQDVTLRKIGALVEALNRIKYDLTWSLMMAGVPQKVSDDLYRGRIADIDSLYGRLPPEAIERLEPDQQGMDLVYRVDVGKRLLQIKRELVKIVATAAFEKATDDESIQMAHCLCALLTAFEAFRSSDAGDFFFQNCLSGSCRRQPELCNELGECIFSSAESDDSTLSEGSKS
jgi:hypothetical protein